MEEHFLTILRDSRTKTPEFREAANCLAELLAARAVQKTPLKPTPIKTPLNAPIKGEELSCRVILVPILRAGLALWPAFQRLFPSAPIGFFGIRRDEKTALPKLYYENVPKISKEDWVFLLDPMLATGGSACLALQKLQEFGALQERITLVSVLAAKEGIEAFHKKFPRASLITAAIDPLLNDQKFIVPGLGDFGDRYFGST